jgi:hypothetical protein
MLRAGHPFALFARGGSVWRKRCVSSLRSLYRSLSFAPLGLALISIHAPRLTPWAAFLRRFAAALLSAAPPGLFFLWFRAQ